MMRRVTGTTVTHGLRNYRELLSDPTVARVVSTGLIARMPIGMTALAFILLIRSHGGSYAEAGVVSAAEALAAAATAPIAGRLIDRHRPATVLLGFGTLFPAALFLLLLLTWESAPVGALVLAAAFAGAMLPPIGPTVRMLWPSMVRREQQLPTAYALEATLQELLFVIGPLIVGVLTALFSADAAVAAAGIFCFVGVLGFISNRPLRDRPKTTSAPRRLLAALSPTDRPRDRALHHGQRDCVRRHGGGDPRVCRGSRRPFAGGCRAGHLVGGQPHRRLAGGRGYERRPAPAAEGDQRPVRTRADACRCWPGHCRAWP